MTSFGYERISSLERHEKEVKFYIMFTTPEEREHAKKIIEKMLDEDKKEGIYQLPAGPDYPMTVPNILSDDFDGFCNDEKRGNIGLEISFRRTPKHFYSPESLEEFIIGQFKERGLHLNKKDGSSEVYEVVGGEPQSFTPRS